MEEFVLKALVILAQKQILICLCYKTGICEGQEKNGNGPCGPPISVFNGHENLLTVMAAHLHAVSFCHPTQAAKLSHSAHTGSP